MLKVCQIFLSFMFYSFLGWCCETVYCSIAQGKIVNRGFLNGPLCPVYGFGALLVIYLLQGTEKNIIALFFAGMLVTSVLEYITSWLLEKLFHMKWWDYSHYRFQINGRVCLVNSLMFGALAVILMLLLRPATNRMIGLLSPMAAALLSGLLGGLLFADTWITVRELLRMKGQLEEIQQKLAVLRAKGDETASKLQQNIDEHREDFHAKKEAAHQERERVSREIRAMLDNQPFHKKWAARRILNAFPHLESDNCKEGMEQMKNHFHRHKSKEKTE